MEQVFDFRQFVLFLWKRGKVILALACILAVLGAGYGYFVRSRTPSGGIKDTYTCTSAVSVNTRSEDVSFSGVMSIVDATLSSDYTLDTLAKAIAEACPGFLASPSAGALKAAGKISIKGNLVLFEATTADGALSESAVKAGAAEIAAFLNGSMVTLKAEALPEQMHATNTAVAVSRMKTAVKFAIFGGAAGIGIGVLFFAFFGIFNLRVNSAEDLKQFGLPILADADRK